MRPSPRISEDENEAIDQKIDRYLQAMSLIEYVRNGIDEDLSTGLFVEEIVDLLSIIHLDNILNGDTGEERYNIELNKLINELFAVQK